MRSLKLDKAADDILYLVKRLTEMIAPGKGDGDGNNQYQSPIKSIALLQQMWYNKGIKSKG